MSDEFFKIISNKDYEFKNVIKHDSNIGNIYPKNRNVKPSLPDVDKRFKFKMETKQNNFIHDEPSVDTEKLFPFYQICQFPSDKKYGVRKLFYNEDGELKKYKEAKLKKDVLDKFLKKSPKYKYTIYPVYDFDVVGFPEPNEILTALSHILNNSVL